MAPSSRGYAQRIRDPLHDLIKFGDCPFERMLWCVIQSRPYQRLRRIRQLGFSEFVYPGATHTRFMHSIGVFHNARRLMDIVRQHLGKVDDDKARITLAAALLHDVGHGPFSHSFENIGKEMNLKFSKHEIVSKEIIKNTEIKGMLDKCGENFSEKISDMLDKDPVDVYSAVVSSQFDADRLDYMQRDRMMTGTQHSRIDLTWLIENLEIEKIPHDSAGEKIGDFDTFVLGPKAKYAAETYVIGLFQLYPTVYFHKATRSAECVFSHLLKRVLHLAREGNFDCTGLSKHNPIIKFAQDPDSVENVIDLDDSVIWGALAEMSDARDSLVQELACRLRNRRLPKANDIRSAVSKHLGENSPRKLVDKAVALTIDAIEKWNAEQNSDIPPIWLDSAERVPYKDIQESVGKSECTNHTDQGINPNQIIIRRNDGKLVDLKSVSEIVNAVSPFKLNRAYIPFENKHAENFVTQTIRDQCKEAER